MKKIIRLTESDLTRIVRRVIMEQETSVDLSKLGLGSYTLDGQDHTYTTNGGSEISFKKMPVFGGKPERVSMYAVLKNMTERSINQITREIQKLDSRAEIGDIFSQTNTMGVTISCVLPKENLNGVVDMLRKFVK